MTQPTIADLDRIAEADAYTRAALEFVWAFTEWWENTEEDGNGKMATDTELGQDMGEAYDRWLNIR